MGNTEKTVFNVAECRRASITVLAPDIKKSSVEFGVEHAEDGKQAVRFGLGAVKNVGVGAVGGIVAKRAAQDGAAFSTLDAFCDAVDWSSTNKRVVESLTKAGALDTFGERAAVLAGLERCVASAQQRQKAAARGQMDLFGMVANASMAEATSSLPDVPAADNKQILEWEKELLGLYLSSHPLISIVGNGVPNGFVQIVDVAERSVNERVKLIGMVTGVRRITTRTNRTMAIVEFEDLTGTIETVAFPDTFEQCSDQLEPDAILALNGKIDERGDNRQLIIESVTSSLPEFRIKPKHRPTVLIELPRTGDYWADVAVMQRVDDVLRRHEGEADVVLLVPGKNGLRRLRSRSRQVYWSPEVVDALHEIVGEGKVWMDGTSADATSHAHEMVAVAVA
jgi:DNA polymerase III subunit alpha